jgi:hypothetical protein
MNNYKPKTNTMNSKWKVFIMTVIGFLVTTVSTLEAFNWAYVVLVTGAFALEYAVKNYWFPSTSPGMSLYWKDILSGLLLAILLSVNSYAASLILPDAPAFNLHILWVTFVGAIVGYFGKTGFVNNKVFEQNKARLKKAAGIILLLLAVGVTNAQDGKFSGFFKPVDQVVQGVAMRADQPADASFTTWIFRPSVTLTAFAIDFREKPALAKSFTSFGFGLSYGKFTTINEKAYCNFSANALLLTSVKIGDVQSAAVGGAVTVDVFNKLLGVGVGYLDKSFMLLTTLSYSF